MSVLLANTAPGDKELVERAPSARKLAHREKPEQLALTLGCTDAGKTVLRDRYMAYPLSISPIFRLDEQKGDADNRAYLYRMNTSPGLLAGDRIGMTLCIEAGSALYLADQAATKVHAMPERELAKSCNAQVNYRVSVRENATLEFLPEPLILFAESELKQTTEIVLAPTAGLSWGEIILPGRLARGEAYQFREYWSTLKIKDKNGKFLLVETTRLLGKSNRFSPAQCAQSELFAGAPVMGLLVLCLPKADCSRESLERLGRQIDDQCRESLHLTSSILPGERGVFIRAVAKNAQVMQRGFKSAVGAVRVLRNQSPLPYSV